MKKILELGGRWKAEATKLGNFEVELPGTLDTNKIGLEDEKNLTTRLTRLHTYEGKVKYIRTIHIPLIKNKRAFLKIERTRELRLYINGEEINSFEEGTLSTPYLFEVTRYIGQQVDIECIVDNEYTKWPRTSIIGSSAATDESQTNWNGILGEFAILEESLTFIHRLRAYSQQDRIDVHVEMVGVERKMEMESVHFTLYCKAFVEEKVEVYSTDTHDCFYDEQRKFFSFVIKGIELKKDCKRWEEGEGNLYELTMRIQDMDIEKTIQFGIRSFGVNRDLCLAINDRKIFLRGETNCCFFPEEGHPPISVKQWREVLAVYESYGVNCMRFHSWCPPKAAFVAADEMGMLMQPELSQWNFKDAFDDEKSQLYYRKELYSLLQNLANHPSFVMLTFGNELQATKKGEVFADKLLEEAKKYDSTRLYANSSNYYYGEKGLDEKSDFYTGMSFYDEILRATSSPMIGHLNNKYPSSNHSYDEVVKKIQEQGKPVFGFEVGQYEILPDFLEIPEFQGVTRAVNLECVQQKVEEADMLEAWEAYVNATGELALLSYKEEVEAAIRTRGMSGLFLLGLQDFLGQGTALVGMINSHLKSKPYAFAKPERFRAFFHDKLPLLLLPKYIYESGEELVASFQFANFSKHEVHAVAGWRLWENQKELNSYEYARKLFENGEITNIEDVKIKLLEVEEAKRLDIEIYVEGYWNRYPLWIYPKQSVIIRDEQRVATKVTEELINYVESGGRVFLEPEVQKEKLPQSIGGQFTTNFWSVKTFPEQEGGMGMLIDVQSKALEKFPTEVHSNYQWWVMSKGRPMILPKRIQPIVKVLDNINRFSHMGLLFEVQLGEGMLLISSMGLLNHQEYPECRALLNSFVEYLDGDGVLPNQSISKEELFQIIPLESKNRL